MGRNLASVSSIQKIDTHELFGLDKDVSAVIDTEVINEQQKDENAASKEGAPEDENPEDVKNQTS